LTEEMPAGEERAHALTELASARLFEAGNPACVSVLKRALSEAGSNAALAARIHIELAASFDFDLRQARRHLHAGLRLLRQVDEPALLGKALVELMINRCWRGAGLDRELAERALEHERYHRPERVHEAASMNLAIALKHTDRLDEARGWFGQALRTSRETGDESTMPDLLAHLADLECWAGNWSLAERYATESVQSFELTGQRAWASISMYVRALVDGHLGRVEAARETAERGLAIAVEADDRWAGMMLKAAVGFAELSAGKLHEANAYLSQAGELAERIGLAEPCAWRFHANEIEAAIGLGELERAGILLRRLGVRGRKTSHPWTRATAGRCQGLLAVALGEQQQAEAALEAALVEHERLAMPFELARSLLVAGQIQRRGKHKRAAKAYLERALEIFESLPAPLWAERARAERARIGLRPAAPDTLSATEQAVADLAAAGHTNRQVAATLFMSPKTVEANLARVYRKLGISSRAQLGAAVGHEDAGQPPTETEPSRRTAPT
jgi:DNA-binding CsgD family transcriptional regulator